MIYPPVPSLLPLPRSVCVSHNEPNVFPEGKRSLFSLVWAFLHAFHSLPDGCLLPLSPYLVTSYLFLKHKHHLHQEVLLYSLILCLPTQHSHALGSRAMISLSGRTAHAIGGCGRKWPNISLVHFLFVGTKKDYILQPPLR